MPLLVVQQRKPKENPKELKVSHLHIIIILTNKFKKENIKKSLTKTL